MNSTDGEESLPQSYHGIELRTWEARRLQEGKENLSQILNRILALGLRVRYDWSQGNEPGERELRILRRTRQVLRAAEESTLIYIDCSKRLLRALEFEGFPQPSDDAWLPELEDWDRTF